MFGSGIKCGQHTSGIYITSLYTRGTVPHTLMSTPHINLTKFQPKQLTLLTKSVLQQNCNISYRHPTTTYETRHTCVPPFELVAQTIKHPMHTDASTPHAYSYSQSNEAAALCHAQRKQVDTMWLKRQGSSATVPFKVRMHALLAPHITQQPRRWQASEKAVGAAATRV